MDLKMKLLTEFKTALLLMAFSVSVTCKGQCVKTNPGEYTAITQGNIDLNKTIGKQTVKMTAIAGEQGAIAAEFHQIKTWEGKYNQYLKTAQGYAEKLKASTTIYATGVQCLLRLYDIEKAIQNNPQGVAATISINNLFAEVVAEFTKTYTLLKNSVAGGGFKNMLTGAERTQLLWTISDQLEELNSKLRRLSVSLAYYNLIDVWRQATAGLGITSKGQIASDALDRWNRARKVQMK